MVTQGLIFPFKELLDECELIKTYAKSVIEPTTVGVIDEARGTLESIQSRGSTTKPTSWEIRLDRPVSTIWSNGESQPASKSKHRVRADFSFIWDIRPLDEGAWRGRKHFLLDGRASTVVRVIDDADKCLARWTVDVGDHQSPGTHFHFQMNGFEEAPFPKSFDVPRLPAIAMSPFLAMELTFAELFQDRWKKHALADSKEARTWRNIHGPRLRRFFAWQASRVKDGLTGSPWIALKLAKPAPDMLVAGAM